MAVISLAVAEARLQTYIDAEEAILVRGQNYTIEMGDSRRVLTRGDLAEIRRGIDYWTNKVAQLKRSAARTSRTRYIVN